MEDEVVLSLNRRAAGYAFLIERYDLKAIPHWHTSFVSPTGGLKVTKQDGLVETVFPQVYWPGEDSGDHLEFALKFDGVNIGILTALFERMSEQELTTWIAPRSTGKYVRRIWFLYEFLTSSRLPIPDLTRINYVDMMDPDLYYVDRNARRVTRQRVMDNLLGTPMFCPVVRKTEKLLSMESVDIRDRCEELVTSFPLEILRRAMRYLYAKETKSSFQIENIEANSTKTEKYVSLLASAERRDFCDKAALLEIQNQIVDSRYKESDYRTEQNYVGQSITHRKQIVHYISPKPEDLPSLMDGLLSCHKRMASGGIPAVVHAAVISYGFVFLHPFSDGNGRIHRFLIHNILFMRGLVPESIMFPVSAAMLRHPAAYDHSLESFSKPLMARIDYTLHEFGQLTIHGGTADFYRGIDMTNQAEALFDFVRMTLEEELVEELDFLFNYDRTKRAIQAIVDMPDSRIDLFVHLCLQNKGHLSDRKRESHFSVLTDEECRNMEQAVRDGYELG